MNTTKYLNRINFDGIPSIDLKTLIKLHECHVLNVPFENLDIQNKIKIRLEKDHLFTKIVENLRGGFCYELNYLFASLLIEIGFDVKIVSAQIFDKEKLGPEFDHMSLIIKLNGENWLADVGFGDLFIKPLKIDHGIEQFDGGNIFRIDFSNDASFLLSKSENGTDFEKKYVFTLSQKRLEEFSPQCELKQRSEDSYFVQNKVCTVAQKNGRKTIFNSKYIEKKYGKKKELLIKTKELENHLLEKEFKIII